MARDFDGANSRIVSTVTALATGDWTIGAWVLPDTTGEGAVGAIAHGEQAGTLHQRFRINTNNRLTANQNHATQQAASQSFDALTLGLWWAVFATYRASDQKIRLFYGGLDAAVIETSAYLAQTAGTGARTAGGNQFVVGNNNAQTVTWDGAIERAFMDAREWTVDEMELFRQGAIPLGSSTLRAFLPLDSPTSTQCEDLSGNGANGTATSLAVREGAPVPMQLGMAA